MGGASSYLALLAIAGFLSATWIATKVSKAAGISSIVLEIAVGVVLGPSGLKLIAPEYAECEAKRHQRCEAPDDLHYRVMNGLSLGDSLGKIANSNANYCPKEKYPELSQMQGNTAATTTAAARRLASTEVYDNYEECLVKSCEKDISQSCGTTPDFFTLVGHAGVAMMIFESGMHFDFEKARIVGPKACAVAVLGTVLPLVSGAALTVAYGKPLLPDGIAVGTALAPTSVGIALRLLGEAGVLQDDFGQAIITAAFVDDILSLILFNVLFSLKGEFQVVPVVVFPIVGIVLMILAMWAAVKVFPWLILEKILPTIPPKKGNAKGNSADEALFLMMMCTLFAYATVTHFLGTHLWGCFIAGMSFACLTPPHHAHHVWVKQTKRATGWMIRIFFACTVAFSIPIGKLLSFEAFWKGSLMGIGPCVLTKVLCAPFMGDARFVIGWAMVGRAEFAYLIAQMAAAGDMISPDMFSVVIWALLYATILAPFVFRTVLKKYIQRHPEMMDKAKAASDGTNAEDAVDAADHGTMSAAGV